MELLLLLAIVYFVVRTNKKSTIEYDGKTISELASFDGTLPEFSPAALAGQGEAENANQKVESLIGTLNNPAKSVTTNPAVSPAVIIQANVERVYEECLAGLKKKMAAGPIITNPEALCRALQPTQKILV